MKNKGILLLCLFVAFSTCSYLSAKPATNYSEKHFIKDIQKNRDIEMILEKIDESEKAEFHRTEISGLGFVSFESSPKDIYMIVLSSGSELSLVCKMPKDEKENEASELKSEVIWPLEWSGKTMEEYSAKQAVNTIPVSAPR